MTTEKSNEAAMSENVGECRVLSHSQVCETNPKPLSPRQVMAAQMLAEGRTGRAAASLLQINERTIQRWQLDARFVACIRQLLDAKIRPSQPAMPPPEPPAPVVRVPDAVDDLDDPDNLDDLINDPTLSYEDRRWLDQRAVRDGFPPIYGTIKEGEKLPAIR